MSSGQRLAKLIADILAIVLIVSIFSGVGTALLAVIGFSEIKQSIENVSGNLEYVDIHQDISKIDIEIASASVYVKTADTFSLQTNDKGFSVSQKKGKLKIEEKNLKLLSGFGEAIIVLTVPEDAIVESFEIDSGTGLLSIENLTCKKLSVESGIGETSIEHINVTDNADIEGGIGDVIIKKGTINNLELSVGMGETAVDTKLTGICELEAGIGALSVKNTAAIDGYTVSVKPGVGEIYLNGEKISKSTTVGAGANIIRVNGGIGNVNVSFDEAA